MFYVIWQIVPNTICSFVSQASRMGSREEDGEVLTCIEIMGACPGDMWEARWLLQYFLLWYMYIPSHIKFNVHDLLYKFSFVHMNIYMHKQLLFVKHVFYLRMWHFFSKVCMFVFDVCARVHVCMPPYIQFKHARV